MKKITFLFFFIISSLLWSQTVRVDVSELTNVTNVELLANFGVDTGGDFAFYPAVDAGSGVWEFDLSTSMDAQNEYLWRVNGTNQESLASKVGGTGVENDIATGQLFNTDFFSFCNRIVVIGDPDPPTFYFNSFRQPGVNYTELSLTAPAPGAGENYYILYSLNNFSEFGGPGTVDNGDGTYTALVRPNVDFEYKWILNNNPGTAGDDANEDLLSCTNDGVTINTDNSSFANRIHAAGEDKMDEFGVCPGSGGGGGPSSQSQFCDTEVFHLDIPAEVASAIDLTIVNTGSNTMKLTGKADDITFLAVIGAPLTSGATTSPLDTSVPGEASVVLTWDTPPTGDVTFQFIQWRKTSTGGATWQINDATTPFDGVCVVIPDEDNVALSDLQVDGSTIDGFSGSTVSYDVEVNEGDAIPVVSATAAFGTVGTITQASALPGTATFDVTSQSTNFVETYTVNFVFVGPQTAAPTPPVLQPSDVVSIYSDAYAEIPGINYDAGFCGPGAVTEVVLGSSLDPTNLVTNGDFQTGVATPWFGNGANPVDLGGGTFFNEVNVTEAGTPFSVNLSQVISLNSGSTYTLTFDAFTDNTTDSRTMLAGLGQNGGSFAALTETVDLIPTAQTFTYTFTINYGDTVDDRVLFDMGADTGFVFINNVSVQEVSTTDSAFAYNGQACQGIDFDANPQDTSGLESGARLNGTINFHVDLYIETGTDLVGKVFNVLLVHPAGDTPLNIDIGGLSPAPTPGTWYSYDATVTLNDPVIRQTTVVSNLNNAVWYDNLYLYRAGALSTNDFDLNNLNVSPNPTKGVWNINSSNSTIDNVVVYDLLGKRVLNLSPNSQQVTIDGSGLKTGIYLARLSSNGLTKTIKLVKN